MDTAPLRDERIALLLKFVKLCKPLEAVVAVVIDEHMLAST